MTRLSKLAERAAMQPQRGLLRPYCAEVTAGLGAEVSVTAASPSEIQAAMISACDQSPAGQVGHYRCRRWDLADALRSHSRPRKRRRRNSKSLPSNGIRPATAAGTAMNGRSCRRAARSGATWRSTGSFSSLMSASPMGSATAARSLALRRTSINKTTSALVLRRSFHAVDHQECYRPFRRRQREAQLRLRGVENGGPGGFGLRGTRTASTSVFSAAVAEGHGPEVQPEIE